MESDRTLASAAEPMTVAEAVVRTIEGLEGLAQIGEADSDAWQYLTDLVEAWRNRLETVVEARGSEILSPAVARAIEVALDEARRVQDPYRAIDWCSTLPQVVLVALDEIP